MLVFTQFIIAQTATFSGFNYNPQANEIKLIKAVNTPQAAPQYQVNAAADAPLFSRKKTASTLPLHAGTPVFLRTIEIIDFDDLTVGQPMKFMVSKDVVVAGEILVRSNVIATGVVTSKKVPTVNNPASIIVEITGVTAVDGQAITLTSQDQRFSGNQPGQSFEIPVNKSVVAYVSNHQKIAVAE